MVSVNGATSWGWVDDDGDRVPRDQATFQLFRIRSSKTGDLLALVAVPPDTGLGQVASIAQDIIEDLEDPHEPRQAVVVNIHHQDNRGEGYASGFEAGVAHARRGGGPGWQGPRR